MFELSPLTICARAHTAKFPEQLLVQLEDQSKDQILRFQQGIHSALKIMWREVWFIFLLTAVRKLRLYFRDFTLQT